MFPAAKHEELTFNPPPLWAENRVWASGFEKPAAIGTFCSVNSTSHWGSWQIYDGTVSGRLVGLDYFGARYYGGAMGRFTSPDGPFNDQDPSNPQSWNLYSYGRNNPLSFIDPDGTTTCDANGNNCHDDVTVSGDSDPVDYVWSFLQAAGSQTVQNAVNATNTALTAFSNFRNNSNCAAALTLGGAAAGASIGAYVGGGAGGAAGFAGGSVVPVAGNAAGLVGGAALGSAGGALAGGSLGGAIGGLGGMIMCSSGAGSSGGGGSAEGSLPNTPNPRDLSFRRLTVDQIKARYLKGGTDLPGGYGSKTFAEVENLARQGDRSAITLRKLLTQREYWK